MTGRHADRRPSLMQIAAAIVGTTAATQVISTSPRDHAGLGLPCDVCGPRCTIDERAPLCLDPHCPSVNVPHYGKPICPPEHAEAWRYDFPAARGTCGHDQVVMWSGVRWVHPMDMGVCDRPPAVPTRDAGR